MATSNLDDFMVNCTDDECKDRLRIFTGVFNPDYVKRKRIQFRRDRDEFDDMIGQYFVEMEQPLRVAKGFLEYDLMYTAVFKDKKKAKKAKKAIFKDIGLKDETGKMLHEVTIGANKYYATNEDNGVIYGKVGSYVNGKACLQVSSSELVERSP